MIDLLVTGFEAFRTESGVLISENPSAQAAQLIAKNLPNTLCAILPVSFERTKAELTKLFEQHQPRVWFGIGFAPHRDKVDVEYIALNVEHSTVGDNDGQKPQFRPIVPDGPMALTTTFPVRSLVQVLASEGIISQVGFHAGTFLCNQVFYLGCHHAGGTQEMEMAAFLHIPPNVSVEGLALRVSTFLSEMISELA